MSLHKAFKKAMNHIWWLSMLLCSHILCLCSFPLHPIFLSSFDVSRDKKALFTRSAFLMNDKHSMGLVLFTELNMEIRYKSSFSMFTHEK